MLHMSGPLSHPHQCIINKYSIPPSCQEHSHCLQTTINIFTKKPNKFIDYIKNNHHYNSYSNDVALH